MKARVWLILVCGGAISAAAVFWQPTSRVERTSRRPLSVVVATDRNPIISNRTESMAMGTMEKPTPAPRTNSNTSANPVRNDSSPSIEDQVNFVADFFYTENRDDSWANETEAALSADFSAIMGGPRLDSVHCRTTVCRLDAQIRDDADQTELKVNLARLSPLKHTVGVFRTMDSQRGPDTVFQLYFAREGYNLPAAPKHETGP